MAYFDDEKKAFAYKKAREKEDAIDLLAVLEPYIPVGSLLLELGIGTGVDFAAMSERYRVFGLDISRVFVRWACERFPGTKILCASAEKFAFEERFSGIYSNKVLYNFNQAQLTKSFHLQAEHLLPEGVAIHTFWMGEGVEYYDGEPCYSYTAETVMHCAGDHFALLDTKSYAEFEANDSFCIVLQKKRE